MGPAPPVKFGQTSFWSTARRFRHRVPQKAGLGFSISRREPGPFPENGAKSATSGRSAREKSGPANRQLGRGFWGPDPVDLRGFLVNAQIGAIPLLRLLRFFWGSTEVGFSAPNTV